MRSRELSLKINDLLLELRELWYAFLVQVLQVIVFCEAVEVLPDLLRLFLREPQADLDIRSAQLLI